MFSKWSSPFCKILITFKFLREGMEFFMSVKKTAPMLPDGLELPAGHETSGY